MSTNIPNVGLVPRKILCELITQDNSNVVDSVTSILQQVLQKQDSMMKSLEDIDLRLKKIENFQWILDRSSSDIPAIVKVSSPVKVSTPVKVSPPVKGSHTKNKVKVAPLRKKDTVSPLVKEDSLSSSVKNDWVTKNLKVTNFHFNFGNLEICSEQTKKIPIMVKGKNLTVELEWTGDAEEFRNSKAKIIEKIKSIAAIYLKPYSKALPIFHSLTPMSIASLPSSNQLHCCIDPGNDLPLSYGHKSFICFGLAGDNRDNQPPGLMLLEDVIVISRMPRGNSHKSPLQLAIKKLAKNALVYHRAWWYADLHAISNDCSSDALKRKIDPPESDSSTKKKCGSKEKKQDSALRNLCGFQDLQNGFSNNPQQESLAQFRPDEQLYSTDEIDLFFF